MVMRKNKIVRSTADIYCQYRADNKGSMCGLMPVSTVKKRNVKDGRFSCFPGSWTRVRDSEEHRSRLNDLSAVADRAAQHHAEDHPDDLRRGRAMQIRMKA